MDLISNIWNHPKTSAAGLLIAITTVAGVLSQQGVTLGKLGTGTVVSLASALATALLGLLAKDPVAPVAQPVGVRSSQQAKLGAWALIALLFRCPGCRAARPQPSHKTSSTGRHLSRVPSPPSTQPRRFSLQLTRRSLPQQRWLRRGLKSACRTSQSLPCQSLGWRARAIANADHDFPAAGERCAAAGRQDRQPGQPATCSGSDPGRCHHRQRNSLAHRVHLEQGASCAHGRRVNRQAGHGRALSQPGTLGADRSFALR